MTKMNPYQEAQDRAFEMRRAARGGGCQEELSGHEQYVRMRFAERAEQRRESEEKA